MSKGDKMFDLSLSEEELQSAAEIKEIIESAVREVNPKVNFTMLICYWLCSVPAEA
tara:strand:+ start:686 stop:853 length:168 start_codon:yes stop_codon:yes gene_type:complete